MKKPPNRSLNPARQALELRNLFPESDLTIGPSSLVWVAVIQPSSLSDRYKVRLRYRTSGAPEITVIDPVLERDVNGKLPHVFSGDRLCLYSAGEWNASMSLATTIVPWTSEWLLHYELWVAGDKKAWSGGGHEPGPRHHT